MTEGFSAESEKTPDPLLSAYVVHNDLSAVCCSHEQAPRLCRDAIPSFHQKTRAARAGDALGIARR